MSLHVLEVVEVDEHDGELLLPPVRVEDGEREPVVEENPVREVGQGVVVRLMVALLFGLLPLRDVDEAPLEEGAARLVLEKALVREDPDRGAVGALQADLVIDEELLLQERRQRDLPVVGVQIELVGVEAEDVLAGRVAEGPRERGVALDDAAVERGAVESREVSLEKEPVPPLGAFESPLVALEEAPDPERDEGGEADEHGAEADEDPDQQGAHPAGRFPDGAAESCGLLGQLGAQRVEPALVGGELPGLERPGRRSGMRLVPEESELVDERVALPPESDRADEVLDVAGSARRRRPSPRPRHDGSSPRGVCERPRRDFPPASPFRAGPAGRRAARREPPGTSPTAVPRGSRESARGR